jgi:outer membrane receptor for ferrienterochelin and colicins
MNLYINNIPVIRIVLPLLLFVTAIAQPGLAQKTKSDTNIVGHVTTKGGEHIPFATVGIPGTAIGTTTDESGHFQLINLPDGKMSVRAQYLGYKPSETEVILKKGETREIKFILEEDLLGLAEVVVTGDRNETSRTGSSTVVTRITPKLFNLTQSATLGEGLNFCPGLRLENNCQNCGFTQVRMNGMEGPYSQILINSRPIFSGLAGVYGLELIPANMIDRVEIIRGGGSALYGSNAIAGTVNMILKDPVNNSYELALNGSTAGIGMEDAVLAPEYSVSANTSLVSSDSKTGMAVYAFNRNRKPFDANGDGFSELSSASNTTFGTRIFHRFGSRSKLAADFFNIRENRRGGDQHEEMPHMSGITEGVDHAITTGALTFERFFRTRDLWSVYVSGQRVNRDSYYGANQSLRDYGNTRDFSYTFGTQYNARFGNSALVTGIEQTGAWLTDRKKGYPDIEAIEVLEDSTLYIPRVGSRIIADQSISTTGVFGQYELTSGRFKLSAGARFDRYTISNREREGSDKSGNVLSPRITLKYDLLEYFQARASYSQGYRAPQIFDEDLHIETSGARQVLHVNDPDLRQETSHSFMASLDFNRQVGTIQLGLLLEGFHTRLNDAFVNEFGEPDSDGVVVYTRINASEGAIVHGINLEMNVVPSQKISLKGGFTFQNSRFEAPHEFNERKFFRTPDAYGYATMDWLVVKDFGVSATGTYTGRMLVPYFGPLATDPDQGELRQSDRFFDLGLKVRYTWVLNGASVQLFAGVKNLFNSYQSDFDEGIGRDPGYIYGPNTPRTLYIGLRFGNMLSGSYK